MECNWSINFLLILAGAIQTQGSLKLILLYHFFKYFPITQAIRDMGQEEYHIEKREEKTNI